MSKLDQATKSIAASQTVEEMAEALRRWGEAMAAEMPGTTAAFWIEELHLRIQENQP